MGGLKQWKELSPSEKRDLDREELERLLDKARGNWKSILRDAGVDEEFLSQKGSPCPVCQKGTDRFTFYDKDGSGSWHCRKHGAGKCGINLLHEVLGHTSFGHTQKWLRTWLNEPDNRNLIAMPKRTAAEQAELDVQERAKIQAKIDRLLGRSRKARPGGYVETYLRSRGLNLRFEEIPPILMEIDNLDYFEEVKGTDGKAKWERLGSFPGMTAPLQLPDGKIAAIHQTYLQPGGNGKASVKIAKKLSKSLGSSGGAIRLMEPKDGVLGIGEGIETVLAAYLLSGIPVWSTYSAPLLGNWIPPEGVKHVVIFADNDAPDEKGVRAGQMNAKKLKRRLEEMGIKVTMYLPPKEGTDFLDLYLERQKAAVQLTKETIQLAAQKSTEPSSRQVVARAA